MIDGVQRSCEVKKNEDVEMSRDGQGIQCTSRGFHPMLRVSRFDVDNWGQSESLKGRLDIFQPLKGEWEGTVSFGVRREFVLVNSCLRLMEPG